MNSIIKHETGIDIDVTYQKLFGKWYLVGLTREDLRPNGNRTKLYNMQANWLMNIMKGRKRLGILE